MVLRGLEEFLLELGHFKIKQKLDTYYLVPGKEYNIKQRRDALFFKPLLYKSPVVCGFAKKIVIVSSTDTDDGPLPGLVPISLSELQQLIDTQAFAVSVKKTTLSYKFQGLDGGHLGAKLELVRLGLKNKHYFSASIEGRDQAQVSFLASEIFKNEAHQALDYVSFLKKTLGAG